jgi:hypothetical protein
MTLVMESDIKDYRLERWIALFLALLFLLPFVAQADETPVALVRSTDIAPITIPLNGTDATLAWRCKSTGIDGFDQCALMLDRKVLTWRMAPAGQQLIARVTYGGEAVRYEVSRVAMR